MSESLQKCSKAYWCMLLSVLYFAAPAHGVTASGNNTLLRAKTVEKPVSGNVVDDKNEPLPGANVVVKGTTIGTTTDAGGNYSISVPDDADILVFSYIGYATQEVSIG